APAAPAARALASSIREAEPARHLRRAGEQAGSRSCASVHPSRPVGVRAVLRGCKLPRFAAVERHAIEAAAACRAGALKQDLAAARGPAWPFVAGAAGQQLLTGAVGLHDADPPTVLATAGEGDPFAVRAPIGRCIPAAAEADAPLGRAVGVHDIELLRSAAVALEDDLGAVGREAWIGV